MEEVLVCFAGEEMRDEPCQERQVSHYQHAPLRASDQSTRGGKHIAGRLQTGNLLGHSAQLMAHDLGRLTDAN